MKPAPKLFPIVIWCLQGSWGVPNFEEKIALKDNCSLQRSAKKAITSWHEYFGKDKYIKIKGLFAMYKVNILVWAYLKGYSRQELISHNFKIFSLAIKFISRYSLAMNEIMLWKRHKHLLEQINIAWLNNLGSIAEMMEKLSQLRKGQNFEPTHTQVFSVT